MLPATVWMFPVWPVSVAARAGERTPTPVPAAIRPATTVTRPRRAGTARRRFSDCWNIVLLLGFEEFLPGAPRTPVPANGRAEARDPDGGEPPDRPSGRPGTVGGGFLRPTLRSLSR